MVVKNKRGGKQISISLSVPREIQNEGLTKGRTYERSITKAKINQYKCKIMKIGIEGKILN
jgi:hypothetical protein